jgi:hypothetical protein
MYRVSRSGESRAKAVLLSLIVTTTAFFFIIAPEPVLAAEPDAIPCPGGVWYWPNCIHFASTNVTNATNTTIFFKLVSSDAYVSLVWGNTTNYGFWAIKNVHYNSGQWYKVFLDFLQPSASSSSPWTYYYKFTGNATGETMGTLTGSWATAPEGTYVSEYGTVIRGVVYNNNGTAHAPSGLEVEVQCTGTKGPYSTYGVTNSAGAYSIDPIIGASTCSADGDGYFIVEVQNYVNTPWAGETTIQWQGRWNESVVIWAAQFVNFYLPSNIIGPWIPQVVDYSNAPSGYSTISFSTTTTFTNSVVDNFAASGGAYVYGAGGGISFQTTTTTSQTVNTTSSYTSYNGSLEVLDRFWTSGTVEFNGPTRTWTAPVETPYGSEVTGEQGPQYITPTHSGMYVIPGYSQMKLSPEQDQKYQVTVTGSTTVSYNFSMNFGITVELDAVSFTVSLAMGWGTSATTTYTNDLGGVIGGPTTTTTECFDIYGTGGSQSSGTATMISIHMYPPNSEGSC